jgi:hypothetical protein
MADTTARLRRDWQEPAHSVLIRHHDDLVAIHRVIRDTFQARIDEAFDRVSQQIGWVVAMTLPVTLVASKGRVRSIELCGEQFKGTLFDKETGPILAEIAKAPFPPLEAGGPVDGHAAADPTPQPAAVAYDFRLIWAGALRVRLRTEWLEPAHFRPWLEPAHIRRPWIEPAHRVLDPHPDPWRVHPAFEGWRERVLISVLDEVYPELQLAARVADLKAAIRAREIQAGPGVREPAHAADLARRVDPHALEEIVRAVRRQVPPEVEEPAHPADWRRRLTPEIVQELDAVLRKYGL